MDKTDQEGCLAIESLIIPRKFRLLHLQQLHQSGSTSEIAYPVIFLKIAFSIILLPLTG